MQKFLQITVLSLGIIGYANADTNANANIHKFPPKNPNIKLLPNHVKPQKKLAFKYPPDILANKIPQGADPKLLGTITNKYAIRDDILAYINQAIPASNQRARDAAIRNTQYMREMEFNPDPDQAREYAEWSGNASWCLDSFIGNEKSREISKKIDKLYSDTKDRKIYKREREANVFGWHVFSTTIGNLDNKPTEAINEFCLSGGKYWE